jgi:hypothetical protein
VSAKDLNPEGEGARVFEAVGYEILGENETAHVVADKLLETYPNSAKVVACWVRTSAPSANLDDLRKRIPPAVADEVEVLVAIALHCMRRKEFGFAEEYAKKAMATKDDWVGPHLLHGEACLKGAVARAKMGYWVVRPRCEPEKLKESLASFNRAIEIVNAQRVSHVKV